MKDKWGFEKGDTVRWKPEVCYPNNPSGYGRQGNGNNYDVSKPWTYVGDGYFVGQTYDGGRAELYRSDYDDANAFFTAISPLSELEEFKDKVREAAKTTTVVSDLLSALGLAAQTGMYKKTLSEKTYYYKDNEGVWYSVEAAHRTSSMDEEASDGTLTYLEDEGEE